LPSWLSKRSVIIEHVFEVIEPDCAASVADLLGATPSELLDQLEVEPPGVWMLSVLDHLREEQLCDREHERVLGCWERSLAWANLRRAEAVVRAAESQETVSGPFGTDDFGPETVALITGATVTAATGELHTARRVLRELPGTRSALERGEISWAMARAVVEATSGLTGGQTEQVDRAMVRSWQLDREVRAWRRKLRREVLKVTSATADAARRRAVTGRRVAFWPLPDGMAGVYAEIPAQDAITVINGLTRLAQDYKRADREQVRTGALGEIRSMDQARADALVDLCTGALTGEPVTPATRDRVGVQVTGGIKTLLGLRDDPGELTGYGPITAQHLRELAADGDWQRFLTAEDTGALIAIGQAGYRPNAAIRRFLKAVRPHCDFPGCPIPADRCDAEHTIPHDDGGPTNEQNMRPRCRRHHRCKTHADWTVHTLPDGSIAWTTPAGTTRIIPPYRLAGDDDEDDDDPGVGR